MLKLVALVLLATMARADRLADGIVEWVRSNDGFFSDKLEIRRMEPSDASSPFGVFAKERIDAKERLMDVPRGCYIEVWDEAKDMNIDGMEESLNAYHENLCMLSHKLRKEMELGKDSEFAPYIAYLETQKSGQLPAMWSKAGKDLLRKVLVPGSDGVDWMDRYYKKTGCIGDDPFEEHIMEMILQRCYDTALIPIWDMVNHDNGRINTENDSQYAEGGIKVRASKSIEADEEIYATYDKCVDCFDIADYWGTPEILRDFGFVERYPQRWVFLDREIWFEIWEKPGELEIVWDIGEPGDDVYGMPNEEGIRFLREELQRLQKVGKDDLMEQGVVPKNEWDVILQFHEAAETAMSMAIGSALTGRKDDEL